jgi:solute carrier family 25 (peroxisomal adenine nucleotide transporter), member 17
MMQMAREIYHDEGLKAFYNGVLPGMILVVNPIINFVVYESVVKVLKGKSDKNPKMIHIFLASCLGKLLATLATYPILTCRVKLQAERSSGGSKWTKIYKMMKRMSWQQYYKGMSAKLLQTILYNAFLLLTYEKMRLLIKKIILASRR